MSKTIVRFLLLGMVAWGGVAARTPPPASPDTLELVKTEQLRGRVEAILDRFGSPDAGRDPLADPFAVATEQLIALGSGVVPFMIAELEMPTTRTFHVAAMVLGRLGTPEAVRALRKAAARADEEGNDFAAARKKWCGYALAMAGEEDAVEMLNRGKTPVARHPFMDGMAIVEVAAVLTAPHSVPLLIAQIQRYKGDEEKLADLRHVIAALSRTADPRAVKAILPLLHDDAWRVRREACLALGRLGGPDAVRALMKALDDPAMMVRHAAAWELEPIAPPESLDSLAARLEKETDAYVRGRIYAILAALKGAKAFPVLRSQWGRPDARDRMDLVDALAETGSRRGLNLCRQALRDPDMGVRLHAVLALRKIGGPGAEDTLLAQIAGDAWPVAETVIDNLADAGVKRAAPRIAGRLFSREIPSVPLDPLALERIQKECEALVALGYSDPLDDLRKARAEAGETLTGAYLDGVVSRMAALRANGDEVGRWVETAASPERPLRLLAYRRLGEIGGNKAARSLTALFDKAGRDDQVEIVRALGETASPEAWTLIEKLLMDPAYDDPRAAPLRNMAAWSARRLGGRAAKVLRASARRRMGLDADVLFYLAVVDGPAALPDLRRWRVPRLRQFRWDRGREFVRLDRVARELENGRSPRGVDRPPDLLEEPGY